MHTAITLGWVGEMSIYIDVPEEECITRFMEEFRGRRYPFDYDTIKNSMTKFNFTDEFRVYDAWGLNNAN